MHLAEGAAAVCWSLVKGDDEERRGRSELMVNLPAMVRMGVIKKADDVERGGQFTLTSSGYRQ